MTLFRLLLPFLVIASSGNAAAAVQQDNGAVRHYVHRAEAGDTLLKLADRFLIKRNDWPQLQKHNAIADPQRIPVGTSIRIPVALMRTEATPAKVLFASGTAESSAGAVMPGLTVREGDSVNTGRDGFVTLQLADGSTLTLQSQSKLKVETARQFANTGGVSDTVVRLDSGRVETRAARQKGPAARYEIRTPTSNMGVRGTQFRVGADPSGKVAQSEVTEGLVGVGSSTAAAGAPIALPAGFGTLVEAGKPPSSPVALLPAPGVAGLGKEFTTAEVRFAFAAVDKAAAYRGQVASDQAFTNLLADTRITAGSGGPSVAFSGLPDGPLYLRLRAIDAAGLEGSDAVHAFRVKARPFAPALLSPQPKATVGGGKLALRWAPVAGVAAYRLQVAADTTFAKPMFERAGPVPGAEPQLASGDYFWRVASIDDKGAAGPWSEPRAFSVRSEKPRLAAKQGINPLLLELPDSKRDYRLQIARDERFQKIVSDDVLKGGEVDLNRLAVNVYYLRIREVSRAADGKAENAGEWSDTGMLEVYPKGWWLTTLPPPSQPPSSTQR